MAGLGIAKVLNKSKRGTDSYAKNLNLGVIHRILDVLGEQGPIKITNLAMYSRMNHIVCKKYLRTLRILGWIEFPSHASNLLIKITDQGKKIQAILDSLNYI